MYEKVNPAHPDKLADRIAGAIVDLAYAKKDCPKIAAEVLLGHGVCHIIAETSVHIPRREIRAAVHRIAGKMRVDYAEVPQDALLAENQSDGLHYGDNGIFKGVPLTGEQKTLALIAKEIYTSCPYDGKYILDGQNLTICQSSAETRRLRLMHPEAVINPLGDWTGGPDVDAGATNRKLGSDMADSVTGGGLHGKDLSKADVSVNIYAFLKAQETGEPVELCCAIGDDTVDLLDLPEEPEAEDFEFCCFHADSSWYGYSEESGMNEEAYEEAMREYEDECERVRSECEFKDSDLYLWVDEQRIEDFDEIRTYLDREIERAEGYEVWIA